MEAGKFNTVIGTLPPNSKLGDGNTIVNAADANGNVIINTPMAVGYGAKAGKDSISIGAFSGGGIDSSAEIVSVPDTTPKPSSGKPNHIIGIGVGVAIVVLGAIAIYIIKTHVGIPI